MADYEFDEKELENVLGGVPSEYGEERLKALLAKREKGEQLTLEELEEVKAGLYQKMDEKNNTLGR